MITCLHRMRPPLAHDGREPKKHLLAPVNTLLVLPDDQHTMTCCPDVERRWIRPIDYQGGDADPIQADADPVPAAVHAFVQTIPFPCVENGRVCWINSQGGYAGGSDGVRAIFCLFDIEAITRCIPALAAICALVNTKFLRPGIKRRRRQDQIRSSSRRHPYS
jgi:hypothetical protein